MSLFRNEKLSDPQLAFDSAHLQAASATAGSDTLPANPAGFLVVTVNGKTAKVPFYNA